MNKYDIGFEQVRNVLASANANTPKGHFADKNQVYEIGANDQIFKAVDYQPLVVVYKNVLAVRIIDIGQAVD